MNKKFLLLVLTAGSMLLSSPLLAEKGDYSEQMFSIVFSGNGDIYLDQKLTPVALPILPEFSFRFRPNIPVSFNAKIGFLFAWADFCGEVMLIPYLDKDNSFALYGYYARTGSLVTDASHYGGGIEFSALENQLFFRAGFGGATTYHTRIISGYNEPYKDEDYTRKHLRIAYEIGWRLR